MDNIRVVFHIAKSGFRKWAVQPRIYLVLILLTLYVQSRMAPIAEFCSKFGYRITPYVFPYFMSNPTDILLIMFTLVLLFCDAPFIESEQPYVMSRSGRKKWVAGQVLYIALASALFFLVIILLTVVFLTPHIEWSGAWGRVIGTFAQTSVAGEHGVSIPFDRGIYTYFTPVSAMLTAFGLCSFMGLLLGTVMFFFNSNVSRSAGAIASAVLILWQAAVTKTGTVLVNFSPVSWVSLSNIDMTNTTLLPTFPYVLTVLSVFTALLTAGSVLSMRKRDIDVLKPV